MTDSAADLATVIRTVAGTLEAAGTELPPPISDAGTAPHDSASGSFTRLCSPASMSAGRAGPDSIVILGDQAEVDRYAAALTGPGLSLPGLVVIGPGADLPALTGDVRVVRVGEARLAFARLSELFDRRVPPATGRHAAAVVEQGAQVAADAAIGAGAVVARGAVIGPGSFIGHNSVVGDGSHVGAHCTVHANVTIYDGVHIGDRVIIHAGAVIGADGFGYAASATGAVKIRHTGGVVVNDDVEIGANTAIDRGTIDDTIIGARTKIDNLCQVGHNVTIGSDCLVAGTAAIGGSVVIGNGVVIGGNVAIADHVTIGNGARVAGRSGVTKNIPDGETWAGFPARHYRHYVRSLYLGDRLEQMWEYVKKRAKAGEE